MPLDLSKKNLLGKLIYFLFLRTYRLGIGAISAWNPKAKKWVEGRKQFPALNNDSRKKVWMHCASLGELEQGRPLLEAIRQQYPEISLVVTFFSPSGYEVMKKNVDLYSKEKNKKGLADHFFYLPMDSRANAAKFITAIDPSLVLWVKYEFWFYYLTALKKRNIPLLMVAGLFRESQPFFKWYGSLWKDMLDSFTHIFVQNDDSLELLRSIGINENASLGGDTRFDRVIEIAEKFEPLPMIKKFCGNDKVIVAGSTWEEDEEELTHYIKNNPQIKFIIAPHEINPANLKDVAKEFPQALFYSELVSSEAVNNDGQQATDRKDGLSSFKKWKSNILIIDNIGMLSRLYYYADITFVGGGFVEDGIHNVLEAAVYGKPVIHGPEYEKFAEAVDLVELGAGISIRNALELEKVLNELWKDKSVLEKKAEAARRYVYSKAGATKKLIEYIQENRLLTS